MIYGYSEPGHLFGWDGEFHYLGIREPPVGCEIFTPNGRFSCFTAGYFFSGLRCPVLNVWSTKDEIHTVISRVRDGKIVHQSVHQSGITDQYPICVSGEDCRLSKVVAEMCRKCPSKRLYVCTVVDGLDALGAVIEGSGESPRRAPLWHPRKDKRGGEFQAFEENLDGDAFGRMADLVSKGVPVMNEIMTTAGEMPFYGSVVSKNGLNSDDVYILKSQFMEKCFPAEPISLRHYAAISVPVDVRVTDLFREATGTEKETVSVFVASDFVPGLANFMCFYHLMTGRGFVCVSREKRSCHVVFRYNGGYKISG